MIIICLSCAWVAGILLGFKLNLPLALVLIGLVPLPLLFLKGQHKKKIILSCFSLVVFFGGAFYSQSNQPAVNEGALQFYNDRGRVEIKGVVSRAPELRDKTIHICLSAREIKLGGDWRGVSGEALLYVPRYSAYDYGNVLLVKGELETPPQFDDFDYRGYLAHQGIYSTMLYPEIEILETGQGFKPLEWVYWLRSQLGQNLARVLPEPQASLAQGIILGIRGNIPPSVRADFVNTGTAHLLAISGLHLSIVAGIILSLGIWIFGRRGYIYIWLALGLIWLYALITGMHPPIIRAAIMVSLFLSAELLGRQRSAVNALVLAAAIMVGVSPQILGDAAFQMSFMAMGGLIFIFPKLQILGRKAVNIVLGESGAAVAIANFATDSLGVSLGAILAVWPLVAYYFGVISWVAPLATLFALPALPAIITTGTLAGVLGFIFLPVAQAVAWLGWLFLSYLLLVINVFSFVPPLKGGLISIALVWGYYSGLIAVIWFSGIWRKSTNIINRVENLAARLPVKWVVPPLAVLAILVSVAAATMPDDNLRVSFLDVGQGDAILVQKGSQRILIDGGPSPQAINLALGRQMPFWDRTIDLVILTHPQSDHITGLLEVIDRYWIEEVLYPELDDSSILYERWLGLIKESEIKYILAQAGQQVTLGDVTIEVLNPRAPLLWGTESDLNNNGVVLNITRGEISFLLTADIMREAEFELIAHRANLSSTVLKVAHHGSDTSTTSEFLSVVNPQVAVISVDEDNPFNHPADEAVDRLEEKLGQENVYRTDRHGTVEFITDGERLWVKTER